jgi:hypothetical protein
VANNNARATLFEKVQSACVRLAPAGWHALLKGHSFDMNAADLRTELLRPLTINRAIPGFEDFAAEATRAIEPGRPSRSLLFHAFASPRVVADLDGRPLRAFPTPAEIEAIENYVYGVRPPTLEELRSRARGAPLAVVVFAHEYRPAASTVHRRNADMCFARTGVMRVGTDAPLYLADRRGYFPLDPPNPRVFRVLPCRYSPYISAQLTGDPEDFGPMRFQRSSTATPVYGAGVPSPLGDASRQFWVPLYKLFNGPECIKGFDIAITLTAHHFNQKLRKVHKVLAAQGFDTGWHEPDLSHSPFIYSEYGGKLLAALSTDPNDGSGLVVPTPRQHLVEVAKNAGGAIVTLKVPPNQPYKSSLNISARKSGARSAPEYVHVRHRFDPALPGGFENLNDKPNVAALVAKGGYDAVHYIDFTADGWIEACCPVLRLQIPQSLPAFSMVSAPHFFPLVDQLELMQWWEQSAPPDLGPSIWPKNPGRPLSLCEMRYPANISYRTQAGSTVDDNAPDFDNPANDVTIFDPADATMTAIVGQFGACKGTPTAIPLDSRPPRASMLPDGAAGVFAPGWDTSIDRTEETDPDDTGVTIRPGATFLTTYGLGSPFPEDAKLCAALSSFWPAAAPDITRTFEPNPKYATATPLPDDVLGQAPGSMPWDGIPARILSMKYPGEIEYFGLDYGDYVEAALGSGFDIHAISRVDVSEYVARTLIMARVFEAVGAKETADKREWAVFSFRVADPTDTDLIAAQKATGKTVVPPYAYRFELYRPAGARSHPDLGEFRKKLVRFTYMWKFFTDPNVIITDFIDKEQAPGAWKALQF